MTNAIRLSAAILLLALAAFAGAAEGISGVSYDPALDPRADWSILSKRAFPVWPEIDGQRVDNLCREENGFRPVVPGWRPGVIPVHFIAERCLRIRTLVLQTAFNDSGEAWRVHQCVQRERVYAQRPAVYEIPVYATPFDAGPPLFFKTFTIPHCAGSVGGLP